eukprot:2590069-Pyramimonas_sp.AAC.1
MIEEAWRERRMADATTLSRKAARTRFGAKQRDGRRLGPPPLDKEVWIEHLSKTGPEGGMEARQMDWSEWRQERENLPVPPTSAGDEDAIAQLAGEDFGTLRSYCRKAGKRRVVPPGTTPLEIWDML